MPSCPSPVILNATTTTQMPYPEPLVAPMRAELVRLGVQELPDAAAVDAAFEAAEDKTMVLIVNSVCGCAAANARPAIALAMQTPVQPDLYTTVFAGQDLDATARARQFLAGIPASSPFIALLKEGAPVFVLERRHIEGRSAGAIATDLVHAFQKFCPEGETPVNGPERPVVTKAPEAAPSLPPTFRSIM